MKARDLIEAGLFYIGVPAATLYPLGFAGLFLQLWSDQLFPYYDYNTLWNAVAMIPDTVVIGTGIHLLFLSLFATLLSADAAWLTFNILGKQSTDEEEPVDRRARRTLWRLFLLSLLPITAFLAYNSVYVNDPYDVLLLAAFLALSVGGGILVGSVRVRGRQEWFRPTLAAAYIATVFAALCLATLDTPNLPLVEVNAKQDSAIPDCSELPKERTFVKVSEASNLMYLYNDSGFFASYLSDIKPVRYLKTCASLRTHR